MGRNVQISKEKILKTALNMLIKDGYSSINIKTLAKEVGCSTQPIAWHFGNMENFRCEFAKYVLEYTNEKMKSNFNDTIEIYLKVGEVYIDMAFDEPNVIRFLNMNEQLLRLSGGIGYVFDNKKNEDIGNILSNKFNIDKEAILNFIQTIVIYTHGLAFFIMDGALDIDKETAHKMVIDTGITLIMAMGLPKEKLNAFLGK